MAERQLYKVSFLYSNIGIGDTFPLPPESEKHTTYVAVFPSPQGDQIKTAVDMALKGALGIDYGKYYPFVVSVEALNTVFIEEDGKEGGKI